MSTVVIVVRMKYQKITLVSLAARILEYCTSKIVVEDVVATITNPGDQRKSTIAIRLIL